MTPKPGSLGRSAWEYSQTWGRYRFGLILILAKLITKGFRALFARLGHA